MKKNLHDNDKQKNNLIFYLIFSIIFFLFLLIICYFFFIRDNNVYIEDLMQENPLQTDNETTTTTTTTTIANQVNKNKYIDFNGVSLLAPINFSGNLFDNTFTFVNNSSTMYISINILYPGLLDFAFNAKDKLNEYYINNILNFEVTNSYVDDRNAVKVSYLYNKNNYLTYFVRYNYDLDILIQTRRSENISEQEIIDNIYSIISKIKIDEKKFNIDKNVKFQYSPLN